MSKKETKEKKLIHGSKVPVKSVVITSVVLVVLLIISIFAAGIFSARPYDTDGETVTLYDVQSILYTKAIVAVMPEKITGKDNGTDIDFYIEVNDEYDKTTDDPVEQYRVYYYKDGKKLVAQGGIYYGNTETMYPLVGFFIAGMNSLKALAVAIKVIIGLIIAAMLALAIYLTYLLWAVKQDRKYNPQYQSDLHNKKLEKLTEKNNE